LAVTGAIVATVAIFSRNETLDDSFRSDNKTATMHDENSFYANCTTSRVCHEIDPQRLLTCLRTPPALCVSFRCNRCCCRCCCRTPGLCPQLLDPH
jgi:hypothetical protein